MNRPARSPASNLAGAEPLPVPRFSVVVPMLDEEDNVEPLVREIAAACAPHAPFETVLVNDGSTDSTSDRIAKLRGEFRWLREVRHARPCGQSAALRTGVLAARAPLIVTIDGDGQNPPDEIPRLIGPLLSGSALGLGLIAGQRLKRQDPASRRWASRLANALRAALLGDHTSDTGCGLKAFPREVFLALPYFDHLHRYLPALVRREGLDVMLIDVAHRPRRTGRTKYSNLGRALVGLQDLLGVWWLLRRRKLACVVHEDP